MLFKLFYSCSNILWWLKILFDFPQRQSNSSLKYICSEYVWTCDKNQFFEIKIYEKNTFQKSPTHISGKKLFWGFPNLIKTRWVFRKNQNEINYEMGLKFEGLFKG